MCRDRFNTYSSTCHIAQNECNDDYLYSLWWDEVNSIADTLADEYHSEDYNFCVVGRSGGYWGFEFDTICFSIDANALSNSKVLSDYFYSDEFDPYDIDSVRLCAREVLPLDAITLRPKFEKILYEFRNTMLLTIKNLESVDYWVDLIQSSAEYSDSKLSTQKYKSVNYKPRYSSKSVYSKNKRDMIEYIKGIEDDIIDELFYMDDGSIVLGGDTLDYVRKILLPPLGMTLYRDRGDYYIVMNVKHKGMPDFDEICERLGVKVKS